jgi:hypothetical protein
MGGYVATCYVDWSVVHSPMNTIIELLEAYRRLDPAEVVAFSEACTTDNNMPNRQILEDASKIFHLTRELEYGNLIFNPQIIHEPWHNRYRIHPGSGRAAALWLSGYERFKTIYTHFDEPGFVPPGIALRMHSWKDMMLECVTTMVMSPVFIDVDRYYAFPQEHVDICKTSNMDSEWGYNQMNPMMPWEFVRYSEGRDFLKFKQEWRKDAWPLWTELQHRCVRIGDTDFGFDDAGKVVSVRRKSVKIPVDIPDKPL